MAVARLAVERSAAEVQGRCWDRLLGHGDYYFSTGWLGFVEKLASDFHCYLTTSDSRRRISCGLTVHQLDDRASPFSRVDSRLLPVVASTCPIDRRTLASELRQLLLPTLSCGGRTLGLSKVLYAGELLRSVRKRTIADMLARAESIAHSRDLSSVSALYVDAQDWLLRNTFLSSGFIEFPSAVSSRLEVPRSGFEAYLSRFRSHRRQRIRRDRRKVREGAWQFACMPVTASLLEPITALQVANLTKYGWNVDFDDALNTNRLMFDYLPDRVEAIIASNDGSNPRAVLTFIQWCDQIYTRQFGSDYRVAGSVPMYFELVYYQLIEEAWRRNVRMIDYSIDLEHVKRARGCIQSTRYGYVKCLNNRDHERLLALTETVQPDPKQFEAEEDLFPARQKSDTTAGDQL